MTSSILRSIVAAGAILGMGAATHAAILDFTLKIDDPAAGGVGHFGVYASVDNSAGFQSTGIASYQITLKTSATGGPVLTGTGTNALINFAPKGTYTDSNSVNSDLPAGFGLLRSGNNVNPATGSQDNVSGGADVVPGFGLTAGSFASNTPSGYDGVALATQPSWGAQLLVLKGAYTGTPGNAVATWFNTTPGANGGNLLDGTTNSTGNFNAPSATQVVLAVTGGTNVPEPASLGVLALGGAALLGRRRKA